MNKRLVIALSMALLASAGIATSASAQEKTRAEVRQELIQAENNGSRFVTDTSYPDINPIFVQQAARTQQRASGVGSEMSSSSAAGAPKAPAATKTEPNCVGPNSFCSIYFGS